MYRRLIILTVIIASAIGGLTVLGFDAIGRWAQGLEWKRLGEFAEVAEQIRQDIKHKLDVFIQQEENRPYMQYQYYYVPDNITNFEQQSEIPLARSPLAGMMQNDFAYGYFQVGPQGNITTVNDRILEIEGRTVANCIVYEQTQLNWDNVKHNLLPTLKGDKKKSSRARFVAGVSELMESSGKAARRDKSTEQGLIHQQAQKLRPVSRRRGDNYPVESLQSRDRAAQVMRQQRAVVATNISSNTASLQGGGTTSLRNGREKASRRLKEVPEQVQEKEEAKAAYDRRMTLLPKDKQESLAETISADELAPERPAAGKPEPIQAKADIKTRQSLKTADQSDKAIDTLVDRAQIADEEKQQPGRSWGYSQKVMEQSPMNLGAESLEADSDTVLVRVEPFVPIVVGSGGSQDSIFGGQVFLLRHVQIEQRHIRQGFKLNEDKLIEEVGKSARHFMREGMSFELPKTKQQPQDKEPAYRAVLDFGFGDLILNLNETHPDWIARQISQLQNWYFSIVAIVFVAAGLGLASLWKYMRAQIKLAQKKDDFISAVSHELRTPLTSIRMYSEMLEHKWVKSEDKVAEYYKSMRQESERLSRLIENVLDFSRIQKGRKKYTFSFGDLNECIAEVVEMMRPYAAQHGFSIQTQLEKLGQMTFDNDAVKQIVVNLIDNAVKYARYTRDKTITVRTKSDDEYIIIEVEDHGPGVPHRQRKKIFEEFYRIGSEATRETVGTGLGLALVKSFAQAHNGFVQILSAKPVGSIFRVGLAVEN